MEFVGYIIEGLLRKVRLNGRILYNKAVRQIWVRTKFFFIVVHLFGRQELFSIIKHTNLNEPKNIYLC